MKKFILVGILTTMVFGVSGCTPGNNVGGSTAAGAIAGGVLGNVLFHGRGSFAGVAAGALIGGIIGNRIGNEMDKQDRLNMQSAIIHTPIHQQAQWTNRHGGPKRSAGHIYCHAY